MELQKRKKYAVIAVVGILLCTIAAIFAIWKMNKYYLELSIPEKTITLEYGVDEMPEIIALCKGTLINKKGTPVETVLEGDLDTSKLGTYVVTYIATYKNMSIEEKRTIVIQDTMPPEIELVSNPEHFTSPVGKYEEEGFTAIDNYDGNITENVIREEEKDSVTYTVSDSSGNKTIAKRTIVYKDIIPPVITLKEGEEIKVTVGKDFVDPGFTAADECDGDITSKVTVEGTVDGHKNGTYTLSYRVEDSSKNVTKIKRTVKIGDFTAPTITLNGKSSSYVKMGTGFSDPGFTATDNLDGDLTAKVQVSGSVDANKMGRYKITYTVKDAAGNKATATRSALVYKQQATANTVNPGDKVVYLTFDDGPGKYTDKLLDILDRYNVKVTFFVTNQFPKYQHLIGEAHRRGHTIALHTYSHNYASLYSSENAYYDDLQKIHDICVKQTGVAPTIVRFPGGTSNSVSTKYSKGIMSLLTESLSYHGYLYCDWNVDSGDAAGASSASAVASNVIKGIKKRSVSNVLQHDIKGYSVDAVEEIIFI